MLMGALVVFALGIGYMYWLDRGCGEGGGFITWSGKECVK